MTPIRHTRKLLVGIHPKPNQDGFPMKHVGNDKVGVRRQTLDRVTRRSPDLGPCTHPEGERLWLREKSSCPPPHRVLFTSHKFQLPDLG